MKIAADGIQKGNMLQQDRSHVLTIDYGQVHDPQTPVEHMVIVQCKHCTRSLLLESPFGHQKKFSSAYGEICDERYSSPDEKLAELVNAVRDLIGTQKFPVGGKK